MTRTLRHALPPALLLAATATALLAQGPLARRRADRDGLAAMTEHALTVDGRTRRYFVQAPRNLTRRTPVPAVLVFHGGYGSAQQIAREHGFRELAEREGFLAVFPDGVRRQWRDGHAVPEQDGVDDFAFVRALLADLGRRYPVDARRTYAAGHSNGAFFSQALACRLPGAFAAIGPVAGQLSTALGAECRAPVSAVQIHGTADRSVPYAGGAFRATELMSVEASAALRAERAGCAPTPTTTRLPDRDPADGTTVRRVAWAGCAAGRGVELWVIDGGTHRWPGGHGFRSERRAERTGPQSREIDGAEVLWAFFQAHPGQ